MKRIILASVVAALAFGCGDDDNNTTTNNTTANNNTASGIVAGTYTLTVLDVDDQCFDGAMDTIVLPDGSARDLPAGVTLPASADLPGTIDITFSAPFQTSTGVAVEASGANGITTSGEGFTQTGVDISNGGDCVADMLVSFTLTASTAGKMTGSGSLSITSATGADCPAFQAGPPCAVISNLEAVKN